MRDAAAWLRQHHGPGPGPTRGSGAPRQRREVFALRKAGNHARGREERGEETPRSTARHEGRPRCFPSPRPLSRRRRRLLPCSSDSPATPTGLPESLRHAGRGGPGPAADPRRVKAAPLASAQLPSPLTGRRTATAHRYSATSTAAASFQIRPMGVCGSAARPSGRAAVAAAKARREV